MSTPRARPASGRRLNWRGWLLFAIVGVAVGTVVNHWLSWWVEIVVGMSAIVVLLAVEGALRFTGSTDDRPTTRLEQTLTLLGLVAMLALLASLTGLMAQN